MLHTYNFQPPKKPTPPKFNMEPENDGFQKLISFSNLFQGRRTSGSMLNFGGVPPQNSIPFFPNLPKVPAQEWATWRGQSIDAEDQQRRVRFVFHLREVAETTFFGAVEIFGRNWPTGFRGTCGKSHEFLLKLFFGGNLCRDFLELFFKWNKAPRKQLLVLCGVAVPFLGGQSMTWQFFSGANC